MLSPIEQKFIDAVLNKVPLPCDFLLVCSISLPEVSTNGMKKSLEASNWHELGNPGVFQHGHFSNGAFVPTGVSMKMPTLYAVEFFYSGGAKDASENSLKNSFKDLFTVLADFEWYEIDVYAKSTQRNYTMITLNECLPVKPIITLREAPALTDAEVAATMATDDAVPTPVAVTPTPLTLKQMPPILLEEPVQPTQPTVVEEGVSLEAKKLALLTSHLGNIIEKQEKKKKKYKKKLKSASYFLEVFQAFGDIIEHKEGGQ